MISLFFIFLGILLLFALAGVYADRKLSAFIQDRLGPMETGKYGLLQSFADILKLLQKEDTIPALAHPLLFKIAPVLVFVALMTSFAVMPLNASMIGADMETGVFFLMAVLSLDVLGVLIAGWASVNTFSVYGAIRSVAQLISYEIPISIAVLCVVMFSQSLSLQEICLQQGIWIDDKLHAQNYFLGITTFNITSIGGFLAWNVFRMPLLFLVYIIFFIAGLAEANRAPFDLPEAESEIISGYHTEYSGFRWAIFMLAEYGLLVMMAMLAAFLFFGGWYSPFPNVGILRFADWTNGNLGNLSAILWGSFWLLSKTIILVGLQMWFRWAYPRLRIDQSMLLCWKYLIPCGLVLFVLCSVWKMLMM